MGSEITQEQVMQLFAGYHATRVISLGVAVGLFEELNKHESGISCESLASKLKLRPEPLRELCSLASKLGLISEEEGKLKIAPKTAEVINEIGGHAVYCMATAQEFMEYEQVMRSGQPIDVANRNPLYGHAVSLALKRTYNFLARNILPQVKGLRTKMEEGASCLEMGCGEGCCIANLAGIYPKSTFLGVDIEEKSLLKAKELIQNKGLIQRVSFSSNVDSSLENSFDFMYTMSSLHEFVDPVSILAGYKPFLRNEGILLVADFTKPKETNASNSPLEKIVHGLFFDEVMQGTPYLDEGQILNIIEKAGYCNITRINTEPLPYIAAYYCNRGETNGR